MGCIIDSNDLKCPLNWPKKPGTRSCICHSILIHLWCSLVWNELGLHLKMRRNISSFPQVLPQSLGEKNSRGYDAAGIYRPTWTVCLFDVYSNHSLWEHWWCPKRTLHPEAQIPFTGISPYHFRSLVPVHPTGSIHGLTYLRLSSAERSTSFYSLWMVMEEVSCLKVIGSHI